MSELPDLSAPSPADGPTTPGRPAVPRPVDTPRDGPTDRPTDRLEPVPRAEQRGPGRTRVSGTLVGLILGAVVLVFLLVFILQNQTEAQVSFLWMQGTLPLGIWLLFAAIAGVLLLAIPGLGRMLQWRKSAGKRGRMVR